MLAGWFLRFAFFAQAGFSLDSKRSIQPVKIQLFNSLSVCLLIKISKNGDLKVTNAVNPGHHHPSVGDSYHFAEWQKAKGQQASYRWCEGIKQIKNINYYN